MKAVRCPICAGTGTFWEEPNNTPYSVGYYRTCHGCDGKGWVEVHEQLLFSSEPVIPLESMPGLDTGGTTILPYDTDWRSDLIRCYVGDYPDKGTYTHFPGSITLT